MLSETNPKDLSMIKIWNPRQKKMILKPISDNDTKSWVSIKTIWNQLKQINKKSFRFHLI